jgi:hypothetical protein
MTEWLRDLAVALMGAEAWGLLPVLSRIIIWLGTLCLPRERREVRRREWIAELESNHDKLRITGVAWAMTLAGICVWERATTPTRISPVQAAVAIGGALRATAVSSFRLAETFRWVLGASIAAEAWLASAVVEPKLGHLAPALLPSADILLLLSFGAQTVVRLGSEGAIHRHRNGRRGLVIVWVHDISPVLSLFGVLGACTALAASVPSSLVVCAAALITTCACQRANVVRRRRRSIQPARRTLVESVSGSLATSFALVAAISALTPAALGDLGMSEPRSTSRSMVRTEPVGVSRTMAREPSQGTWTGIARRSIRCTAVSFTSTLSRPLVKSINQLWFGVGSYGAAISGCPGRETQIAASTFLVWGRDPLTAELMSVAIVGPRGSGILLGEAAQIAPEFASRWRLLGASRRFALSTGDAYVLDTRAGAALLIRRELTSRYVLLPPALVALWLTLLHKNGWTWPNKHGMSWRFTSENDGRSSVVATGQCANAACELKDEGRRHERKAGLNLTPQMLISYAPVS